MYKLTQSESILRLSDNALIPPDLQNTDYVEYLKWVSEGNQAEPEDPIPEPQNLTPEEKLAMAGLTVEELKILLDLN